MTTALSPSTMPVSPLIDPSTGEPVNMETTILPSIMQEDGSADVSTKGAGLYVGVGCGVAIIFILVVVLLTATVFRRKRLQHSKAETEQEDKPYMDLMTRDTQASVYETIGTSTITKKEESSYENQNVVTQHRVMNQVTQEDDHTYEMAK
ncbi:uncharacterized protein LOC121431363 isoform X2 [Lytechinus variegatus]|uniref:uncharacterized protein LOC121431363 isoform X2 n=1 Tax=Lytechinus variegatus TaxID=7654 RepID=UPI001BB164D3|nr:uncharacterized protein LOC121431363 isoform X2 [Lytechinus variegatus]